jgi:hypothetical protein
MSALESALGPPLPPTALAYRGAPRKPCVAGELCDGTVKIVPYCEAEHLDALHRLFSSSPEVFVYLGKADASAATASRTRSWIHAYADAADCQTFVVFVSTAAACGEVPSASESSWLLAGTTSYLAFRPDDLVIEIGNVAGEVASLSGA